MESVRIIGTEREMIIKYNFLVDFVVFCWDCCSFTFCLEFQGTETPGALVIILYTITPFSFTAVLI